MHMEIAMTFKANVAVNLSIKAAPGNDNLCFDIRHFGWLERKLQWGEP